MDFIYCNGTNMTHINLSCSLIGIDKNRICATVARSGRTSPCRVDAPWLEHGDTKEREHMIHPTKKYLVSVHKDAGRETRPS